MKTGMILYIAGKKESKEELGSKEFKNQLPAADLYRFAVTEQEVSYYWWELTAKGMHRILCKIVQFDEMENVQVSDNTLRLCG